MSTGNSHPRNSSDERRLYNDLDARNRARCQTCGIKWRPDDENDTDIHPINDTCWRQRPEGIGGADDPVARVRAPTGPDPRRDPDQPTMGEANPIQGPIPTIVPRFAAWLAERDHLAGEVERLKAEVATLWADNAKLADSLASANERLVLLQDIREAQAASIMKYRGELDAARTEAERLKKAIHEPGEITSAAENRADELARELHAARTAVEARRREFMQHQEAALDLYSDIYQMVENACGPLPSDLTPREAVKLLADRHHNARADQGATQDNNRELRSEIEELGREKSRLKSENHALRRDRDGLLSRLAEAKEGPADTRHGDRGRVAERDAAIGGRIEQLILIHDRQVAEVDRLGRTIGSIKAALATGAVPGSAGDAQGS